MEEFLEGAAVRGASRVHWHELIAAVHAEYAPGHPVHDLVFRGDARDAEVEAAFRLGGRAAVERMLTHELEGPAKIRHTIAGIEHPLTCPECGGTELVHRALETWSPCGFCLCGVLWPWERMHQEILKEPVDQVVHRRYLDRGRRTIVTAVQNTPPLSPMRVAPALCFRIENLRKDWPR